MYKINEIFPYDKNPRINDNAIEKVKESIKEFGFTNPILIDNNNVIVAGHTRYKASMELGLQEVPCVVLHDLTNEQIKAYRLVDNKTAEFAEWDFQLLDEELESILDIDMSDFGFDLDFENTYGETSDELQDVEANEDLEEESITVKRGDVWKLGEHYLFCCDSTIENNVEKIKQYVGNGADLIVTDPPYNVAYEGKTKDALKIQNDNMDNQQFKNFLLEAYKAMNTLSRKGASIYVFHADLEGANFRSALVESGFLLKQCCIWIKNIFVIGRQDYQWKHEPILYGWKEGAAHSWYGDRKQTTTWFFDKPLANREHPTMKPIDLIAYPIKNSSKEGDLVLDIFGGSGSTLLACEQLNRRCVTSEIEPKYAQVIINRWEELTGEEAEKIDEI